MTTLYRFFDSSDRLLYIGIAGNPGRRFDQHAKEKHWWGDVVRSTMEHFTTRQEAADAERSAIVMERPVYNVAHANGDPVQDVAFGCSFCRQPIYGGSGYVQADAEWHTRLIPDPKVIDTGGSMVLEMYRHVGVINYGPPIGWLASHNRCMPIHSAPHAPYRFSTADLSTASLVREFVDDMMAKVPAVDLRPFYALMVIAPAALTDAA